MVQQPLAIRTVSYESFASRESSNHLTPLPMMKSRLLRDRLLHILHPALLPRLHHHRPILPLPKLTLLILLRHITRRAATRTHTILAPVPLQMVLRPYVAAVQHRHDEADPDAREPAETHAAEVTARVAGHVAVVLDSVVGAADDDAGTPP